MPTLEQWLDSQPLGKRGLIVARLGRALRRKVKQWGQLLVHL
tara:strand:+ start:700 stop:825 length:126 start_codon:yes stop_codon:yes gene_type:complete